MVHTPALEGALGWGGPGRAWGAYTPGQGRSHVAAGDCTCARKTRHVTGGRVSCASGGRQCASVAMAMPINQHYSIA